MPELPEVETTLRGITPHVLGQVIRAFEIREPRLRWPVPPGLNAGLAGQRVDAAWRRGKYIVMQTGAGALIWHLGMSGSLRITPADTVPRKHDHLDMILDSGACLRFHDPRRFGCLLWTQEDPLRHELLARLGPEPLGEGFDGGYLHARSRSREVPVKSFIMDSHVVVGVGNIYASESLFRAGIAPQRSAGRISLARYERLAGAIRDVLAASIAQGGTTLRDFVNEQGNPGYFRQTLQVYDREGQPCRQCGEPVKCARLGQRSTYWCPACQR